MGLVLVYLLADMWQDPGAVRVFWLSFCDLDLEEMFSALIASRGSDNCVLVLRKVFFDIAFAVQLPTTSAVAFCPGGFSTRGRTRLSQPAI